MSKRASTEFPQRTHSAFPAQSADAMTGVGSVKHTANPRDSLPSMILRVVSLFFESELYFPLQLTAPARNDYALPNDSVNIFGRSESAPVRTEEVFFGLSRLGSCHRPSRAVVTASPVPRWIEETTQYVAHPNRCDCNYFPRRLFDARLPPTSREFYTAQLRVDPDLRYYPYITSPLPSSQRLPHPACPQQNCHIFRSQQYHHGLR